MSDSPVSVPFNSAALEVANKDNNTAAPDASLIGALTVVATAAAPTYVEGRLAAASTDLAGNLRVTATINGADRIESGSITSTEDVPIDTQAAGSCGVQVVGVWTGTIVFEATVDGATWAAVNGVVPDTGVEVSSTTVNGIWIIACAGFNQVRLRGNVVGSGSASVFLEASVATQIVILGDPLPTGSNVIGAVIQSGGPWTQNLTQVGGSAVALGQAAMAASIPVVIASDQSAVPVVGSKTHDGAAPGTNNIGALVAVATAAAPTFTEGNQVGVSLDLSGALRVVSSSGGTSSSFAAAFPAAGTAVGFSDGTNMQSARVFDADTGAGTEYVEGVSLRKSASGGSVEAGTATDPLRVDPTGATTQPISGTVTANAGTGNFNVVGTKSNNGGVPGSTNLGTLPVVATAAAPSYTEGNQTALSTDLAGNLRTSTTIAPNSSVNLTQIAGTAASVNNGTSDAGTLRVTVASDSTGTIIATQATAANLNAQVVGSVAHDAADAGNPVKVGGQARTTNPTSVGDGDRVNAIFDKAGRQLAVLEGPRELKTRGNVTLTTTTETTLIAAGGASVFHDMILLTVTSSDQVNLLRLDIRDTTGGTVIWSLHLNAGLGAVGFVVPIPSSLPQTTANTNWTVQLNATPTAGQTVRVFAIAVKNL
jgi:hypothetical protein